MNVTSSFINDKLMKKVCWSLELSNRSIFKNEMVKSSKFQIKYKNHIDHWQLQYNLKGNEIKFDILLTLILC